MSVETETITAPLSVSSQKAGSRAEKRGRSVPYFVKIGGLILLGLIVIALCFALYVWLNRYDFAERYTQRVFRAQGVEAELSIKSLSKHRAVIDRIRLTYQDEGEPFFTAKRIEADFILEEALNGQMRKLRFVAPQARITLNEKFEIVDGWVPPRNETASGGFAVPSEGVFVEDADFTFNTPYGVSDVAVSASIYDTNRFNGTFILAPTSLTYKAWGFDGSARVTLDAEGDNKDLEALVQLDTLRGEMSDGAPISIKDAAFNAKGRLVVDSRIPVDMDRLDMVYRGELSGNAKRINTPPGILQDSQFDWVGDISRNTALPVRLGSKGELALSTDQFTFSDPARAQSLAETLTLSEALSRTPIAQHFGPSVTQTVHTLLEGASLTTRAKIDFDATSGTLNLLTPLEMSRGQTSLTLMAFDTHPLYVWSRAANDMTLSLTGRLNRPLPITLRNGVINAQTDNGWQLQGIKSFTGAVSTGAVWETKTVQPTREGNARRTEIARLRPFTAALNYQNTDTRRTLNLQGGVDFDGRVPGGYVEGLSTRGRVDLRLAPQGQTGVSLSYTPSSPKLTANSFITETDWRLNQIAFNLEDGQDIFKLSQKRSVVDTAVSDVSFNLAHKSDGRSMDLTVETVSALGMLYPDPMRQDWDLAFTQAFMRSDTIAVPGTEAESTKGQLKVIRTDTDINFDLSSPDTTIRMPQGRAKEVSLTVTGTPQNFELTHEGGIITSETIDIPEWPLTGRAQYDEGVFTGTAEAIIPNAKNVPAKVDYRYSDGAGEASINIASLAFAPGGLQPQNLSSVFAGKIAQVEGVVSADLDLSYVTGQPVQSKGVLRVSEMNFGTAPGPVTGLNAEINLTSLFPLETAGRQVLTVKSFDPGFPLENGTIEYDLVPEGLRLHAAKWPMGSGAFTLDPFTWRYGAEENRVIMRLDEIPINEFLQNYGDGKLDMTGTVRGEFPIIVRGISVLVDNGYLEAPDGGVIRYRPNNETAITYSQKEALEIIRRKDTPQYRSLAQDALREFNYRALSASIDGPLDGAVQLGIIFDGSNKKVLNGQPFEFDIDVEGELFNIMRSFNSNAQIKSELLRDTGVSVRE